MTVHLHCKNLNELQLFFCSEKTTTTTLFENLIPSPKYFAKFPIVFLNKTGL